MNVALKSLERSLTLYNDHHSYMLNRNSLKCYITVNKPGIDNNIYQLFVMLQFILIHAISLLNQTVFAPFAAPLLNVIVVPLLRLTYWTSCRWLCFKLL